MTEPLKLTVKCGDMQPHVITIDKHVDADVVVVLETLTDLIDQAYKAGHYAGVKAAKAAATPIATPPPAWVPPMMVKTVVRDEAGRITHVVDEPAR